MHPTTHGDPPTQPIPPVREPVAATSPWTFVDVFAGLGAVLLVGTVIGAAVRLSGEGLGSATLLVTALPIWLGLLGTTIWACRRHGTGHPIRDLAIRVKPIDLAIGLGAGIGLRLAIGIWALVCTSITGQNPTSNLQTVLGGGLGSGAWLVLNALAIGLIGPLVEEVFFRGVGLRSALASLFRRSVTQPRLADPRRRARLAIAATALVFALLHLSEVDDAITALVLLPGLFLAGWVLGWLTIRTGRLGPAIVTHVVFNGVAVVALLAMG